VHGGVEVRGVGDGVDMARGAGVAVKLLPGLAVGAGVVVGAAAAGQWVPSVVSLGQWTTWSTMPGGWCRWRGQGTRVALTFDDGPDPACTPAVVDALARLGLPATFFCLGSHVDAWPDLVRSVVDAGHLVGTHGYHHRHHLGRPPWWVGRDLDASLAALGRVGVEPRWFRPPYGQVGGPTLVAARARRLELALWSAWGREWAAPDAGAVTRRLLTGLAPGAIVLLHDSDRLSPPGSVAKMLDALGPLAEELNRRGLSAVTLDELVSPPGPPVPRTPGDGGESR
jgi:peptidoglycan/xylan/chitin deacetylase (PgdA/CDA1 family)